MPTSVDALKAEIVETYDHVYIEWSQEIDFELAQTAWLINLPIDDMFWC